MTTFVVTGAALHEAASWASRIVPGRPYAPILGGLLMEVADDLTLTAFDFETCGSVTIPATVKESGRALVSARLLTGVAKTVARDVDVIIETASGAVEIRCGRSEWSAPAMPVGDYPGLPPMPEPVAAVDAAELRRALSRVLPAVATAGDAPALGGVLMEGTASGVTLIATDRYRFAAADVPATEIYAPEQGFEALVPGGLMEAAVRAVRSGPVRLCGDESTFGLATSTHTLAGRQIADPFPPWRSFVPDPRDAYAVADVAELRAAIEQARAMTDNGEDPLIFAANDGDGLRISAPGDGPRASAEIDLISMTDEDQITRLRPGYVLEALTALESPTVELHFYPRMVLMLPVDGNGEIMPGFRTLVMRVAGK